MKTTFLALAALAAAPFLAFGQARPEVIDRNPDGSIRSRGVYESSGNGQVTKFTLYDGTGNIQQTQVPYYGNNGRIVRADTFDRSGRLTQVAVYLDNQVKVLDAQGNVVRTSDFAADTFMRPVFTGKVWFDGNIPAGASPKGGGEGWMWGTPNPASPTGGRVHQTPVQGGQHEHSFEGATDRLSIPQNGTLFAWVYLDPSNPPKEVMLMFRDGSSWEHRAYWGSNVITYGQDNSHGRTRMGDLPPMGQWVKLTVPANAIGLGGASVDGMGFALVDGRASWGAAGVE